jgi:excinuclease ABC subunit C
VLYVGKAKSLRQRLNSYFQDPAGLAPRTAQMVSSADHVEWMVVDSESEALLLEHNLIKQYQPRFNVRLKDDKSYPWLALTISDEWPRPAVVRGRKRKGVRYFGPYPNVGAIRDTLDLLLRSFPVRTCSDTKFRRHQRLGRPCLLYHIERCAGPCVGAIDHPDYDRLVGDLIAFLSGDTGPLEKGLENSMKEAAQALEFERASVLRDKLDAVRAADAVRQMELERKEDLDVIGIAEDELEAAVQVFHVRQGKVVGRLALFVDKVEDLSPAELIERVLVDVYADPAAGVPRQVLVPTLPDDIDAVCQYVSERRGGPVVLRVPVRGPKRALLQTVEANAKESFVRHRLHRTADHNSRARALESLQKELDLPDAPLRIECFDMSHLQGTDYVGSMVVFEDGLPKKSEYRHFRVQTVAGNDDYAAMEEVLTRRLTSLLADDKIATPAVAAGGSTSSTDDDPSDGKPKAPRRRFAYPPQLLLVDGGLGQLNVGVRVLDQLGLTDRVPIASLAKSFEEVYRPGRSEPLRLSRQSEGLRHHLPPDPAGQAHDRRCPRRGHRARAQAEEPAGRPVRGPGRPAGGFERGAGGPIVVAGRRGGRRLRAAAHAAVPERGHDQAGRGGVMSEYLVVTGMSGAGRSTAGATLEDLGWFVIDNMPSALISKVSELVDGTGSEMERVAFVV